MKHWNLARQRPLLLQQNLFTASMHPHYSMYSCCFLCFICISVLKHSDVNINDSSHPQAPQQLQEHFASTFQENCEAYDPDDGSLATQRCLQHFMYKFVCLIWISCLGVHYISADLRKSTQCKSVDNHK